MRKGNERGAIVVEATVSLTAFIFAIFTILSIVNVYYIQAKISMALNSAAKEISQYSYLYYALGVDKYDAQLSEGTEDSKLTAEKTIDGVDTLIDSFTNAKQGANDGDFDKVIDAINSGEKTVESLVDLYGSQLEEDPKGFIKGMGKLAMSELKEEAKSLLAQVLAKSFMKKNLKAYRNDNPDAFLRRYRVVDGMDGLDFNYTTLMAYGTSNQIFLCVTYDVSVIKLLDIDVKFTFRQAAQTTAWGNGISLIKPEENSPESSQKYSVWDNPSPTERGKIIVLAEKKKYTYTSSGQGFDAYNNARGANQFVTIMSLDTTMDTYQNADQIRYQMNANYNSMSDKVSKLDETVYVQNQSGATVPIKSQPSTRTYKIVLVIPDNSDMSIVNKAVKDFKDKHPGVVVEINTEHGHPTPKTDDKNKDNTENN